MKTRAFFGKFLFLAISIILVSSLTAQLVNAQGSVIYIRADGTVDPPTAAIVRNGDVYTFADNVSASIVVERSDIVVDGNYYTLQGAGDGTGFEIYGLNNVTVKNTVIQNFTTAVDIYGSTYITVHRNILQYNGGFLAPIISVATVGISVNNTFSENTFTNNTGVCILFGGYFGNVSRNLILDNNGGGIQLGGSYHRVYENTILNCTATGLVLYGHDQTIFENVVTNNTYAVSISETGTTLFLNNFVNNTNLLYEHNQLTATWTNGTHGNYWDDYDGTDGNGDGIGDTPFVIDENNQDALPLVEKVDVVSIPEISSWTLILVVVAALGAFLTVYNRKTANKSVTKTSI